MGVYRIGRAGAISLCIVLAAPALANAQQGRPAFCGAAESSRWSTAGGSYQRNVVFGQAANAWLLNLAGLAATEDRVFVYDAGVSRVHVLTSMLQPVTAFGHRGDGPGELAVSVMTRLDPHRYLSANSLAVDDSTVYVYDGRSIEAFRYDGTHVDRIVRAPERMLKFSLGKLQPTRHGLFYSFDSLDVSGTGKRRLQTWRVVQGAATLVHSSPLWGPPIENGRYSGWYRDPRPLWGVYNHCLVWADGVSHFVVRRNLISMVTDTIHLPLHSVPPSDYDASVAARRARDMGSAPPPPRPENAPLWHWSGLIVDPDGHVWVRPWTLFGLLEGPVYRIDPRGNVHEERLPAFPMAFGAPGVYYVRDVDPDTDEVLVVRYDRRPGQ